MRNGPWLPVRVWAWGLLLVAALALALRLSSLRLAFTYDLGVVQTFGRAGASDLQSHPLWGMGLFQVDGQPKAWEDYPIYREAPNPNWGDTWAAPWATQAADALEKVGAPNARALNTVRGLARIELWAGRPDRTLGLLESVMSATGCDNLAQQGAACTFLWIDAGDALDGLGRTQEALNYYRAAGWFRRREAGTELLLQSAEGAGNQSERARLYTEAAFLLPDALPVLFARARLQDPSDMAVLQHPGDPRLVLAVRRDPRLERRQAEVAAELKQTGIWDQTTWQRVLAFRAWEVDLHSFGYANYRVAQPWTPQVAPDAYQMAALYQFFAYLDILVPNNQELDTARTDFFQRLTAAGEGLAFVVDVVQGRRENNTLAGDCSSTAPHASNKSVQENLLAATDFGRWWSYGASFDVASQPAAASGQGNVGAGWVVGPDTHTAFCSRPSYRTQCTWTEPGAEQSAELVSTLLTAGTGQAARFSIPTNGTLCVDFWWRADPNVEISYRGKGVAHTMDFVQENGWQHSRWLLTSAGQGASTDVGWSIEGCGTFWLGEMTVGGICENLP
jgi:tetratricopeptide (TPR) repeat protein